MPKAYRPSMLCLSQFPLAAVFSLLYLYILRESNCILFKAFNVKRVCF